MSTRRYPDPHDLRRDIAPRADVLPAGDPVPVQRRSRSSVWLVAAMLAVLLAVGVVVNNATADNNPHPGAPVSFAVGEDVTLQNFQVHINGARLAQAILDDGQRLETAGVWLIVDLSYANVQRPALLGGLGVRDDQGRTYTLSERYTWGTWMAAPDTWFRGEVAFEVPSSAVAGGEIELLIWPRGRTQAESMPMPYGTTRLSVDTAEVATATVEVARSELLPVGQR